MRPGTQLMVIETYVLEQAPVYSNTELIHRQPDCSPIFLASQQFTTIFENSTKNNLSKN